MSNDLIREQFIEALKKDRYDYDTRKIYSDWLEDNGFDDEALFQRSLTPERINEAKVFMERLAYECSRREYEDEYIITPKMLIDEARKYVETGEELIIAVDTPSYDEDKFWEYYMVLTEQRIPKEKLEQPYWKEFISCSC